MFGLLPPPLWGRAGEGGGACRTGGASISGPPPPTPPHKGEGSRIRPDVRLMLYVSILVELLRSRPALAVWLAALAQGLLWTLVPTMFYAGPPGDLPLTLAIGHEFQLGSYLGPPLAFWLAELAYDLAGRHLF